MLQQDSEFFLLKFPHTNVEAKGLAEKMITDRKKNHTLWLKTNTLFNLLSHKKK